MLLLLLVGRRHEKFIDGAARVEPQQLLYDTGVGRLVVLLVGANNARRDIIAMIFWKDWSTTMTRLSF
jgi:hypothetical protein